MIGLHLLAVAAWEAFWWQRRNLRRVDLYAQAKNHARRIGKTFVVLGAPDLGATRGPGPGDVTIDIAPSRAPNAIVADVTRRLPLADDSCVVFVSCVLEYVTDLQAAMRELWRVGRDRIYICTVEPWTLAAYLYPGARRVL